MSRQSDLVAAARRRIALADALRAVGEGEYESVDLASVVQEHIEMWDDDEEGSFLWALTETLNGLCFAVRWNDALRSAEPDAERFAVAARLRGSAVLKTGLKSGPDAVLTAARALAELKQVDDVAVAADALSTVMIAPRLSGLFSWRRSENADFASAPPPVRSPSVALLIRHNDEAVMRPTVVQPGSMHQMQVEIRVDKWPEEASELHLAFISVHPKDYLYASDVVFQRNDVLKPLEIRVAGERPANDPRLALTARAHFRHGDSLAPAHLVGNTTLDLVTFNPGGGSLAGLPTAALRLTEMMGELGNAIPQLPVADRRDVRLLIEGVLRFAHTALDDRLSVLRHETVDEPAFQRELRQFLQADPDIGARLVEAQGSAGGITDLGLGQIVLELKVEKAKSLTVAAASEKFGAQAVQYASAGDSRVSLLAVLEATAKRAPAGVMGNEVAWCYPETTAGTDAPLPSMLGVIVIRSGFPVPSSFSR